MEQALGEGLVLLQGAPASHRLLKNESVASLDELAVEKLLAHLDHLERGAEVPGVQLIDEGREFSVVFKPAGIPTVPVGLFDENTITAWVRWQYPEVNVLFDAAQPELAVHRLDTDTAGLIIVGLTPDSHLYWRKQFSQHRVEKQYTAWVWGTPSQPRFRVQSFLEVRPGSPKVRRARGENGIFTELDLSVLESHDGMTKVEVVMNTGVRHQVRAQLAFAGLPLVGDSLYDEKFHSRPTVATHHMLWASKLATDKGTWQSVPSQDWRPR
jgi:23S rRNA pseudouridine1911/1915/1917 synthase